MKHKEIEKSVLAYADNELKGKHKEEIEEHLKKCSKCQELLNIIDRVKGLANTLKKRGLLDNFLKELLEKIK